MPPPEPPSEVTIRVKVPPGHINGTSQDEFALGSLSTSHPIAALRQRIQTLVPSNPRPTTQRILYGGRALADDAQSLADALNTKRDPTQTEYVVHLLVRPGGSVTRDDGIPGMQTNAQIAPHDILRAFEAAQPQPQPQPRIQTTTNTMAPPAHAPVQHHAHPHGQPMPPPRPLSSSGFHIQGTGPDGRAFSIHRQVVTNTMPAHPGMPTAGVPPQPQFPFAQGMPQMPFPGLAAGLPNIPLPLPMATPPNMTQQGQTGQQPVVSALERARENMAEMRRMVDRLRTENAASATTRAQVAEIEQRMQAVIDYIDPFHVGRRGSSRSASPSRATPAVQPAPQGPMTIPIPGLPLQFNMPMMPLQPAQMPPFALPPMQMPHPPALMHHMPHHPMQMPNFAQQLRLVQPASGDRTSVYLLSSPQGPHALVFTPQHGTYTGILFQPSGAAISPQSLGPIAIAPAPTPTQPGPAPDQAINAAQVEPNAIGEQANIAQLQAQADPLAFFQPMLGHLWLLLRVMIFAYIVMGSNMGWRRPIALALIGLGFWLIRLGLFGNGGLIRRWWDGVVRIEGALHGQAANNGPAQPAPEQHGNVQPQPNGQAANAGGLPTPEEYAQRLIRERQERSPLHRLREQIRPAERALALFVASLWPGVGERYVQLLDRAREEEEAARRAIEAQQADAARIAEEAASEPAAQKTAVTAESSAQSEKQGLVEADAVAAGPAADTEEAAE